MIISDTVSAILRHKGTQVWSIEPERSVFEAIELMAAKNVGALLVVEAGRLVGILSERDYTRKIALRGRSSRQTRVREILSETLVTATPAHTIEECMRLMTERRIRHLPVLDGDAIRGVVSIGDLVNWIISAQKETIQQLEHYIAGQYPG
jgi:CBS domain-containing protein